MKNFIRLKTTTATNSACRTWRDQTAENWVERREQLELGQIMRVFESQPKSFNSDTVGNMETCTMFDENVMMKVLRNMCSGSRRQ